ncbi:hypothetical protein CLOM_g17231 [Closterium sp. NIES-68]|nr:hypothetical protein CLOM_g17231 [Closterium sp. NIES-68]GJP67245.1 hypothetical protein CLOP_g24088 [Closterium sp. NIES-67]
MAVTTAGEGRGTFSARLLPLLVLALLLQAAPTAFARHWFWNHGLFPVVGDPAPVAAIPLNSAAAAAAAQTTLPTTAVVLPSAPALLPAAPLAPAEGPPVLSPSALFPPALSPPSLSPPALSPPALSPPALSPPADSPPAEAPPAAAPPPPAAPSANECYDAAPVDPLIARGAAPDPCAALAAELNRTGVGKMGNKTGGMGFAAPSLFRACYAAFLFREKCDFVDLLSIANAFNNHYVYKHIAMDSPDQTNLPSSIDIIEVLGKIVIDAGAGKYAKLADAHMAAHWATMALNDGHSAFMPTCFMSGEFNLPLPLMAVVENGQQIIRVAPRRYITPKGMNTVAKALHNFDFDLYEGRQVVAINGDKAEDYILKWADKEVGTYRNRAARFNRAFARNEVDKSLKGTHIRQVPGSFARRAFAPENDTVLVSFATTKGASTEDVQVPWIGSAQFGAYENALGYWAQYCAVPKPSDPASGGTSAHATAVGHADTPVMDRILPRHPPPVYYEDSSDASDTSDASDGFNVEIASVAAAAGGSPGAAAGPTVKRISPTTDHFLVYLVGGSTAVIWLHEYDPSDEVTKALEADKVDTDAYMVEQITKALQTAAQSNASQVIIDVRGNGGGSTVAAYATIRLLMGAQKVPPTDLSLPMDFIISNNYTENAIAVLSIDRATQYFPRYTDLNGTSLTSAFGYAPFRTLKFSAAGPAGNYSAIIKSRYELLSSKFMAEQQLPVFGDRPFLVLSDGVCFSSCGILTHVLGKRHKVPMVTLGGLPNQPPDVGSSCLGFTLSDMTPISTGLSALAALHPMQASKPLKVKGTIGMAFTNGYIDSEIPCEFEFLPSQHHIEYTVDLIDKPWAIWSEVAKLFATTAA